MRLLDGHRDAAGTDARPDAPGKAWQTAAMDPTARLPSRIGRIRSAARRTLRELSSPFRKALAIANFSVAVAFTLYVCGWQMLIGGILEGLSLFAASEPVPWGAAAWILAKVGLAPALAGIVLWGSAILGMAIAGGIEREVRAADLPD